MEAKDLKLTGRYQIKANKQVANITDLSFIVPLTSLDTAEGKGVVRQFQVWWGTEVKLKTRSKF